MNNSWCNALQRNALRANRQGWGWAGNYPLPGGWKCPFKHQVGSRWMLLAKRGADALR